jgi:UDP-glucose 4-epimerase
VFDVVDGVIALLDEPRAVGEIFNLGSDEEVTILSLAYRVKELTRSRSEIRLVPYDEAYEVGFEDMQRRVPDLAKLSALVGYRPKRKLDEILQSVIDEARGRAKRVALTGNA